MRFLVGLVIVPFITCTGVRTVRAADDDDVHERFLKARDIVQRAHQAEGGDVASLKRVQFTTRGHNWNPRQAYSLTGHAAPTESVRFLRLLVTESYSPRRRRHAIMHVAREIAMQLETRQLGNQAASRASSNVFR